MISQHIWNLILTQIRFSLFLRLSLLFFEDEFRKIGLALLYLLLVFLLVPILSSFDRLVIRITSRQPGVHITAQISRDLIIGGHILCQKSTKCLLFGSWHLFFDNLSYEVGVFLDLFNFSVLLDTVNLLLKLYVFIFHLLNFLDKYLIWKDQFFVFLDTLIQELVVFYAVFNKLLIKLLLLVNFRFIFQKYAIL